ncbi:MAG TPA: serine/threonine-protein kinase [Nannocystaceae bacterium]|nr:serine/threonine-protein kinase [Nannocystaceae bacterium]
MSSASAADDATQLATSGASTPRAAESSTPGGHATMLGGNDRYATRRELGRGGMGAVSLAFDRDIDREIAVKRLISDSPEAIARFVDEARIVGKLEHPNIAPVHDIGVDDQGRLFFVMKYVEGDTLRRIIERLSAGDRDYHERFGFDRRLDIFAGIVRALKYAHKRGIVHRDVKPDNVIVGPCGEVMLMDWGIAHVIGRADDDASPATPSKRMADETADGSLLGTLRYMSPEQAAGKVRELDGRSDLYSAFVVLYELLALRPFIDLPADSNPLSYVTAPRTPPPLAGATWQRDDQRAVPTELRHFLRWGLQEDPAKRPADAGIALDELHAIRTGDVRVQCPVTLQRRMMVGWQRMLDRSPVLAFVPLVLVIAFVIVALAT